jgi:Flp pilus assembly protein TadD
LVAVALVGCRLPGREGPVSKALASSRQLSHRGLNALERGDARTAQELLGRAVETCPADPEAREHYAEALWRAGQREAAIAQVDAALKINADDGHLHARAGQMRLAIDDVDGASREAETALRLDNRSPEAWRLRAQIALRRGRPRQALADLHRAASYEPQDRDLLLDIAETYRQLGQPQQALVTLQDLSDKYPLGDEPQQVLYLQGLAQAALGRSTDAAESFTLALGRGVPTAELYFRLAEAQAAAGQADAARASLASALQLEPAHVASQQLLGSLATRR